MTTSEGQLFACPPSAATVVIDGGWVEIVDVSAIDTRGAACQVVEEGR